MKKYVDENYISELYHLLHRCPEIGYDLPKTVAIVKGELEKIGIKYTEDFAKSSVVGYINPEKDGFTIAIRADMDALPIEERSGLDFSSEHKGAMHACGHDIHTAILLGAAKALYEMREKIDCRIKLIFQPNEEGADSAAGLMVKNGVLDDVDIIIGLHNSTALDVWQIGVCEGPFMAGVRNFEIEVFGKTSHATRPEAGCDAIAASVDIYKEIKDIVNRKKSEGHLCLCSVGAFNSGSAHNVISDYAELKGTLRTYDAILDIEIFDAIRSSAESAAEAYGCTVKLHSSEPLCPVINDPKVTNSFRKSAEKIVGKENVITIDKKLSSEDFADYLAKIPGTFFNLGVGTPGDIHRPVIHNSDYKADERGIAFGGDVFVQFVLDNMNGLIE